jgi:CheY-like chemotaxis protein/HPt (histidine-containing phosphotransfer) domain-containing protein
VTSAEAAIARSRTENFDLVFMDLNMSDMDGFEATKHIRASEAAGRRMPVIALTAHDAHSYRERVLAAGMDDILSKPYTLQDCQTMLARWMARKKPVEDKLAGIDAGVVRALGRLGKGEPNALHKRLGALFETTSQPLMAKLSAALRDQDLEQAANLCHTLKSSAANVGAMAFSETVRELELLCRDADSAGAAAVHQRLAAAYEPLLAGLRARRMAATA